MGSNSNSNSSSLKAVSKPANSPSSSTTSSSKRFPEDGQSSPASSTKPHQYLYTDTTLPPSKEIVTVTVRFRPLSPREIRQGEEIAWYADGDSIVRNEHNPSLAYAYDRVFGPTTTTRHVYDVAAQNVVSGAMEGINGTIFAYGVTSSGKTHTMHGDQRSPGIIPLAVKDAFSIIQETPSREYLLRVSYLEIYNEVVNDLLNPTGHNLRIREDSQGTFVEGVKEEVVLSPAHALSLIAAGEEHRHVGSTNFNLLSSRSHTIFTLTIESSPCGENNEGEAVNLSQLNLIDLAGSESSKAETTGVRRKEGSYINKSLLTLGTVISKLTDGRATHIPYRDSKLTRLLQSSLSGHGRVSLICTVTPSSSNSEETHNTLKFAHRAKHIEIQAAHNKIIDEKSLIKKYQNEIRCLKEELEQLRRGITRTPELKDSGKEDIVIFKQKLEDGQIRLQSRLEQEEEAKAALLGRIQRLTKLILVSTKASHSSRYLNRQGQRRRHSFGEEELAYLPHRRRDLILDEENVDLYVSSDGNSETVDDQVIEEKKPKKHGLLSWLKPRKRDSEGAVTSLSDKSSGVKSVSTPSTPQAESVNFHAESGPSHSLLTDSSPSGDLLSETRHDIDVPEDNFLGQQTSLEDTRNLNDEIKEKNEQKALLEKQIIDSMSTPHDEIDKFETSQSIPDLVAQLNDKSFELEVKAADNRIIQEQLNQKICECEELHKTVTSLKKQLDGALELKSSQVHYDTKSWNGQLYRVQEHSESLYSNERQLIITKQAAQIEELKQQAVELIASKEQLELRNQKIAEESSYAKGLASAAAVELKALSEEVAKLMNQNQRLSRELISQKSSPTQVQRRTSGGAWNGRREAGKRYEQDGSAAMDMKRELASCRERELTYEAALVGREQQEAELERKVEECKQREAYLENELANMWVLVAKLKKSNNVVEETPESTKMTRRTSDDNMWNDSLLTEE